MIKLLDRTAVQALLKRDVKSGSSSSSPRSLWSALFIYKRRHFVFPSAWQSTLVLARSVNTVPDRVLEATRHSKLGKKIGSPAVEGPVEKAPDAPFEAIRDYK